MKKRIFGLMFLLFVAISVMSFHTLAEEDDDTIYYINYCGKWITNKNLSVKTLYSSHDAATFDPDTNTLTHNTQRRFRPA